MRPVAGAILAFIIGVIATYILVIAGGQWLMQGVSDPGGGRTMQIMFMIGPLCALAGGVVAAIVAARALVRRQHAEAAGEPAAKPRSLLKTLLIVALIAVALIYLAARALFGIA